MDLVGAGFSDVAFLNRLGVARAVSDADSLYPGASLGLSDFALTDAVSEAHVVVAVAAVAVVLSSVYFA